ncbi:hypothetical protein [Nocardioides sp. zg-DK7169]|uniref:hypothetical protein n=1 Tax=Nocardioides sp. zg-DK7169 TaxID=2736600 RepID=UPI0015553FD3|nr:hypothetical protein [Nocardioides sp. zg-DK7169]NPC97941.1 hypothetical protein [Nocardioides sp. zg-DK7169]
MNLLSAMARRWVVVLIGLGLTAVGCWQVAQLVGTQYQASSQLVLLLPPQASGVSTPTNPFLNMQAGQVTVASLLAGNVSTPDVRRTLAGAGADAEYDVALVPGAGPIMQVTSTSTDAEKAVETRNAVMKEIDAQLARMQARANVPPRQLIEGDRSGVSDGAEELTGSRIRALGGTAAVGLLLTLLVALGLDRLWGGGGGTGLPGTRADRGRRGTDPVDGAGVDADGVPDEDEQGDAAAAGRRPASWPRVDAEARSPGDKRSRRAS